MITELVRWFGSGRERPARMPEGLRFTPRLQELEDRATPSGVGPDFNLADNPLASVRVTPVNPIADLTVAVSDGVTAVTAGASVSYVVTLTNNGPSGVGTVTLLDTLPATLTDVTFTASVGIYNPATGVWTGTSLAAAGQSATLTVYGTVAPGATGTLMNVVSVFLPAGGSDANLANNVAADNDQILHPVLPSPQSANPGPALQGIINYLTANPQALRGLNIALGDTTGDGVNDLVLAGGRGQAPVVSVIDGQTGQLARQFVAFPGFNGGVRVFAVDINGDGVADIIASAAVKKGPHIKVFDGLTGEPLTAL
jgi:uncharacterized repeat protein (TIGR01451 family)